MSSDVKRLGIIVNLSSGLTHTWRYTDWGLAQIVNKYFYIVKITDESRKILEKWHSGTLIEKQANKYYVNYSQLAKNVTAIE